MSATNNPQAASGGPIDQKDMEDWVNRFNGVLANAGDQLNAKSPESAQPWHAGLFDCFNPIDLCLMTWCIPCVTFGKTHHRMKTGGSLEGWQPINTSCLLFTGGWCTALWWLPACMQRQAVREKYNLQGSGALDLALSCCCCYCCSMIQQDKEVEQREALMKHGDQQQYQAPQGGMSYPETTKVSPQ